LTIKFTRGRGALPPAFSYQLSAFSKTSTTPVNFMAPFCSSHAEQQIPRFARNDNSFEGIAISNGDSSAVTYTSRF
jgi:hypothetical protein